MDDFKTLVVFRVFKDGGDVVALFPEVINYLDGACESYQRIGQHGAADYSHCIAISRPATPSEYAALKRELERNPFGYNLEVRRKYIPKRVMSDTQLKRIVQDLASV